MKKIFIYSSIVLCIVFLYINKIDTTIDVNNNALQKLIEKGEPYDQLAFQRAYPNEKVNLKQMDKAYKIALEDKLAKSNSNTSWTLQGPNNIGGRINCVAVDPDNTNIIYAGCSTGGVFRTLDSGTTWEPIADELDFLPISSIVLDPNNSNIIYVGTGDHNISGIPHIGNGIYKSIDGGNNWNHMGLTDQRIISRIKINPNNSQILYAATMGLPFERNNERGLYKSIDGGLTWTSSLFISDEAGIIDLVMDITRPDTLFASSWNRIRNNNESIITGYESNIYRTYDGGENWETVDTNLPMSDDSTKVSRIGLDMSGQNPGKVYALIVNDNLQIGTVASIEVGSDSWDIINFDTELMSNALGGFGWYFGQIRVNPSDDNEISVLGVDLYSTFDNGDTWSMTSPPWWQYQVHADKHDMLYQNGSIYLATDGGLYRSSSLLDVWYDIEDLPNTQFYRVAVDPFNPGYYTGGAQDNGTTTGKSGELWTRDRGGDGFKAIFDPIDSELMYSETQTGGLAYKYDSEDYWTTCIYENVYQQKRNWDMPWIMSSHDHTVLYCGAESVFRMTDAPIGAWDEISDDLTSGETLSARRHTITTVSESPFDENLLYAGESGGKVWRTTSQGGTWDLISSDLPLRYVTDIKASSFNENTVYVTLSGFRDNDTEAHIYKSEDKGDSWVSIGGDLGDFPVNHIEILSDSSYVVATDVGVYSTANFGANWFRVGNNMPIIPVFDIEVDEAEGQLVAATFARSMMTFPLDSLSLAPVITDTKYANTKKISVYPNPASDYISLGVKGDFICSIFSLDGKLVSKNISISDGQKIDIIALPEGNYIIHANLESKDYIGRFMKK